MPTILYQCKVLYQSQAFELDGKQEVMRMVCFATTCFLKKRHCSQYMHSLRIQQRSLLSNIKKEQQSDY